MINKGIYPALLTPFTADGKVNEKALADLIELNIKKNVNGFYVTGSTAEVYLLTEQERIDVMRMVAEMTNKRCSIIAHVGSISTDQAIRLAKEAEKLGYDAISAVTPFYYSFPLNAIKKYYSDIVNSTELPMIIYNIPAMSGVKMTVDDIDDIMAMSDKFAGIKNTASDYFLMEKIRRHNPDKLVFNGYDETFLCGLSVGADGSIGSTFNFMAEKYIDIRNSFIAGDIAKASEIQHCANIIIEELCRYDVLQAEKAVLRALGIPMGICRSPILPLTAEQEKHLLDTVLPLL